MNFALLSLATTCVTAVALADGPSLNRFSFTDEQWESLSTGISRDGSTAFGGADRVHYGSLKSGFRLLPGNGTPSFVPEAGRVLFVSEDGNTVIRTDTEPEGDLRYLHITPAATTVISKGFDADGEHRLDGFSADGSTILGTDKTQGNYSYWRWTLAGGKVPVLIPANREFVSSWSSGVRISRTGSFVAVLTEFTDLGRSFVLRWDAAGALTDLALPQFLSPPGRLPDIAMSDDGTVFAVVQQDAQVGPFPTFSVVRWDTAGAQTAITLPSRFGHSEKPKSLTVSPDGSTLFVKTERSMWRVHPSGAKDLGPVVAGFSSTDGATFLGTLATPFPDGKTPVAWTANSGLVDLNERLAWLLPQAEFQPFGWANASLGIRGVDFIFTGRDFTARREKKIALAEVPQSALTATNPYAGTLLDSAAGSYAEREKLTVKPVAGVPDEYEQLTDGSASLRVEFPISETLDASSPFELRLGARLLFAGQLSDGGFTPSVRKAEFLQGRLKLSWTANRATMTFRDAALLAPLMHREEIGEVPYPQRISGSLPLRLRLGTQAGSRILHFAAKVIHSPHPHFFSPQRKGTITASGSLTAPRPAITAALPANGTRLLNRRLLFPEMKVSGGAALWMRKNNGPFVYLGTETAPQMPVLLTPGENRFELEARDTSGGVLSRLTRTFHYLEKAGTYTVPLIGGGKPRGVARVTFLEHDRYTATIVFEGKTYRLSGDESSAGYTEISRGPGLPVLVSRITLTAGAEHNSVTVTFGDAQTSGSGTSNRENWSQELSPSSVSQRPSEFRDTRFHALLAPGLGLPANVEGSGCLGMDIEDGSIFKGLGKLPDGTAFSFSAPLTDNLRAPIYVTLPGGGSLAGEFVFDLSQPQTDVTGTLFWHRPATGKGPFGTGWSGQLTVRGSKLDYPDSNWQEWQYRFSGGSVAASQFDTIRHGTQPATATERITIQTGPYFQQGTIEPADGQIFKWTTVRTPKQREFGGHFITPFGSGKIERTVLNDFVDGPATDARFYYPKAISVRSDGVYVGNRGIRKIAADGTVSTWVGLSELSTEPTGISPSGAVACSDYTVRYAEPGDVTLNAGAPGSQWVAGGPTNRLPSLHGIVHANGVLYVACEGNVRSVHLGNITITSIPRTTSLTATGSALYTFRSGTVLQKFSFHNSATTDIAGSDGKSGFANGTGKRVRFNSPGGMAALDNGTIFVADSGNHVIRRISDSGEVTTFAGSPGIPGRRNGPANIALFNNPGGIAADADGNLYVADTNNHRIRKITPAGIVSTLAGPE